MTKATKSEQFLKNIDSFRCGGISPFDNYISAVTQGVSLLLLPLPSNRFNFFFLESHQLANDLICCDPLTITTTISVLNHETGTFSTIASTINCPTLLTRFRQVLSQHSRDPVLILWPGLPSALGPMVFSHHFTFCILR